MSGLIQGVQLGMASGEAPVELVTTNVQVAVSSALVTGAGNTVLTTPATASQSAYGAIQPKITLGSAGLSGCSISGGYVQLSAMQWGFNPYPDSVGVKSHLLRFASSSSSAASSSTRRLSSSSSSHGSMTYTLPGIPAYYIALQFSNVQSFNFSASKSVTATTKSTSNFTLPACTLYNGVKYVPCKSCNISSYTNYNVTYSCFDITQLCPVTSVRRYLQNEEYVTSGALIVDGEDDEDEDEGEEIVRFSGERDRYSWERDGDEDRDTDRERDGERDRDRGRRSLAGDDDASAAAAAASASTYGTLLESVLGEIAAVLSSNPFLLDLSKSVTVLSLLCSIGGFIVIMLIYLLRLDYNEKLNARYVKKERDAAARKMIEEELRQGGKGDLGASYEQHIKQIGHNLKAEKSVISTIRRQRNKAGLFSGNSSPSNKQKVIRHADLIDKDGFEEGDYLEPEIDNFAMTALITEFLHKLFPGSAILSKRRNIPQIISNNHDYFKMLAGAGLTHTRTIRFLNVVTIVLVLIFVNTVFFGIYFPPAEVCSIYTDKVRGFITTFGDKYSIFYFLSM